MSKASGAEAVRTTRSKSLLIKQNQHCPDQSAPGVPRQDSGPTDRGHHSRSPEGNLEKRPDLETARCPKVLNTEVQSFQRAHEKLCCPAVRPAPRVAPAHERAVIGPCLRPRPPVPPSQPVPGVPLLPGTLHPPLSPLASRLDQSCAEINTSCLMGKAVRRVAALAGLQGGEGCVLGGGGHGLLLGPKASWISPAPPPSPRGQAPRKALRTRRGPRPAALRLRASLWVLLCEFRAAVEERRLRSPLALGAGDREGLGCSILCSRLPHPHPAPWRPPLRPQGSGSLLTRPPPASTSAPVRSPESIFPGLLPTQIFRGPCGDGVSSCSVGSRPLP